MTKHSSFSHSVPTDYLLVHKREEDHLRFVDKDSYQCDNEDGSGPASFLTHSTDAKQAACGFCLSVSLYLALSLSPSGKGFPFDSTERSGCTEM